MSHAPVLRTQRLVGEPAAPAHLDELADLFANRETTRTLDGARSREQVSELLALWSALWSERGLGPWILREAEGGAFVGYGGLAIARAERVAGEVELLYGLLPRFWRRGLATELARAALRFAFRDRALDALVAYTMVTNTGSRGVLERCGFAPAGEGAHAGLPHVFYRLARGAWERGSGATPGAVAVRELAASDAVWARAVVSTGFGSPRVVSRGRLHHADRQPGFVGLLDGAPAALLTFEVRDTDFEVVVLASQHERRGLATALLEAAEEVARARGCQRLWLVTTNDNTPAIDFYERQGWRRVAVHAGAVDEARRLKPEIPLVGHDGVPITDEIEFERRL